jgi:uncharacterized membrane protein (UPF0127 family)
MPRRTGSCLKGAVAALFCFLGIASFGRAAEFRTEELTIHRQDGRILNFVVELATNDAEREQGLMNREDMKPDRGMLFDFGVSRPVYMWMKNTYLPLDMLFISADGRITSIRSDTLPLSEDIINSHGAVRFVLEINSGISYTLGIKPGDTVTSAQIERAKGSQ